MADIKRTITLKDGEHKVSYPFFSLYKTEKATGQKLNDLSDDPMGFALWLVFAGIYEEGKSLSPDDVAKLIPNKGLKEIVEVCREAFVEDASIENDGE